MAYYVAIVPVFSVITLSIQCNECGAVFGPVMDLNTHMSPVHSGLTTRQLYVSLYAESVGLWS